MLLLFGVNEKIEKAIEEHNPDAILSIWQAGGRFDISVEHIGINLDDFRIRKLDY